MIISRNYALRLVRQGKAQKIGLSSELKPGTQCPRFVNLRLFDRWLLYRYEAKQKDLDDFNRAMASI